MTHVIPEGSTAVLTPQLDKRGRVCKKCDDKYYNFKDVGSIQEIGICTNCYKESVDPTRDALSDL